MLDANVGTWSLYTVLLAVVMLLISLVLMVVLLVMAMLGRFRRAPAEAQPDEAAPPDPEPLETDDAPADAAPGQITFYDDPDGLYDGFEPQPPTEAPPAANAAAAGAKTLAAGFSTRPKARGTGLWQLIAALLACVPALMSAAWVDNMYGRLVTFTVGAGLNLALLAAQIFLIAWTARLQSRR